MNPQEPVPVPGGVDRPAPARLLAGELHQTPAYLTGVAERLFAQVLAHLTALRHRDPALAREIADRWSNRLRASVGPEL